MSEPEGWRRPGAKRCTDTAIWLLRLASREPDWKILTAEDRIHLLKAAELVDAYGQRRLK